MELIDKKVLVVGYSKSGIAATRFLLKKGAKVIVTDLKKEEDFGEILNERPDFSYIFGREPEFYEIKDIDLIVVSPGVPLDKPFLQKAKENGIEIISEVELAYRFCKAPIVAITGTNGKTTTTTWTGEMIKNSGRKCFVVGNIGYPIIDVVDMADEDSVVVAEISSFQLESSIYFKPKVAVILNITPDHLNRHKTFENYVEAKSLIFKNQDKNDFTILNADDSITSDLAEKSSAKVVFFSRKKELNQGFFLHGDYIVLNWEDKLYEICKIRDVGIPGLHNLENALAAATASFLMGVDTNIIGETIRNFKGVEHRLEFVRELNGVKFYNDSKGTNPDASIKAIEALDRPLILIAGGYDKGSDFTEFVKAFNGRVKYLVLLGQTADKIKETAERLGFKNIVMVKDMQEAVRKGYELAEEGDCVLLSPACASWDMFKNFEERGRIFKEAVYSLGR